MEGSRDGDIDMVTVVERLGNTLLLRVTVGDTLLVTEAVLVIEGVIDGDTVRDSEMDTDGVLEDVHVREEVPDLV
jgi:hypothetical protein